MSECDDEEYKVPMTIRSELFRLASALGIDGEDVRSEEECVQLIDRSIRSVERLKSEKKSAKAAKTSTDENSPDNGTAQEKKLAAKAKHLEDDLRISLKTFEDPSSLKAKITHLHGQVKKEKEQRAVLEKFIETQNKKIVILVTHVDKLMKALKRESGKTIKSLELNRQLEKENFNLSQKIEKQTKVIAIQNRYVSEIAEGSRILQDQLALMDEKYLELRNRLESSRKLFATQMSKIHKESSELRVKYSMATHGKLLDALPMPSNPNTFSFTGESEGFRVSMDQGDTRASTSGKKGKPRAASAHATSGSRNAPSPAMTLHHGSSPQDTHFSHGQSFSFQGQAAESWNNTKGDMPYDVSQFKDKAAKLFAQGMTHNHQYNQSNQAAHNGLPGHGHGHAHHTPHVDPALREKQIVRKITDKQKKSGVNGWTEDRLQELINS